MQKDLVAAAKELEIEPPRDFWHVVLFYTTEEVSMHPAVSSSAVLAPGPLEMDTSRGEQHLEIVIN